MVTISRRVGIVLVVGNESLDLWSKQIVDQAWVIMIQNFFDNSSNFVFCELIAGMAWICFHSRENLIPEVRSICSELWKCVNRLSNYLTPLINLAPHYILCWWLLLYSIQKMSSSNLYDAAKNGNVSLVKNYLDAGADANYKNPNEVIRNNIGYCWTVLSPWETFFLNEWIFSSQY